VRRGAALLAGGLLVLQGGAAQPTTPAQAARQITESSMRPLPSVPPREVPRPDTVWVPDRWIPAPGTGGAALVPGHWERRVSDRESYTPPLTGVNPADGSLLVFPAGVRPPAEERREP